MSDLRTASCGPVRDEIVDWLARLGAASAEDVALRFGLGVPSARAHLAGAVRAGRVQRRRLLHGQPALYVASRDGLRQTGHADLGRCRVSPASAPHWQACARVAVELELERRGWVMSDRELRLAERLCGRPIASAELGWRRPGEPATHRPDLVWWPGGGRPPLAVEVELTVKAPRRLQAICRAWARVRTIGGVVYFASPRAARALRRAVGATYAEQTIEIRPLPEPHR